MGILNGLCAAYFFVVALLQFNDPDPWIWVPLYLLAALLAVGAILRRVGPLLLRAMGWSYLAYALWTYGAATDWGWTLESESLRESMGLLLVFAWSLVAARGVTEGYTQRLSSPLNLKTR